MPALTGEERRSIVKHALGGVGGGGLSVGALSPLLEADDAGVPMYLLLAVEEIKVGRCRLIPGVNPGLTPLRLRASG
jgi:hypothetical protein